MVDQSIVYEVLNTIVLLFAIVLSFLRIKNYFDKWILRIQIDTLEFILEPLFPVYPDVRERINEVKRRVERV